MSENERRVCENIAEKHGLKCCFFEKNVLLCALDQPHIFTRLPMFISPATLPDIPSLLTVVNSAFRGDAARQGWTHESDLIHGEQRTDEATLQDLLQNPAVTLLKCTDEAGRLLGCVCLQVKPRGLYLGMLTVAPALQGAGIGKKLLAAADDHARQCGCAKIYMTVFSVRHELVAWYLRHGYRLTGEVEPYGVDPKFGVPTQPLEFVILEKEVAALND